MKVIVLGSGPAGLMAAQGIADALENCASEDMIPPGGAEMSIISRKVKSPLYGAQYLHQPIPRMTPPEPRAISYQMRGSTDDYRRKVYGQMWDGTVSPEDLAGNHMGWDIRATYDALWERWEPIISDVDIDPIGLRNILTDDPDLIINSIPRPVLCHQGHSFGATEVWAAGDAPELGINLQYRCTPFSVVCNGDDNPSWYRMSNVFGRTTIEWPGSLKAVPVTTATRVQKPTQHQCDCWADAPMEHVGRYGEWSKGVLSHTAYFKAYKRIDELIGAASAAAEAGA